MLKELQKPLTKDDVELRVGSCSAKGFSLLIYKTARTDINRLNDVCGISWSNSHKVDAKENVTCAISVYDENSKTWVSREDTGSESNTEKQKGSYSDSFKRAGFRWGIGIELYKSPFIWISGSVKDSGRKDKYSKPVYVPDLFTNSLVISEYDVVDGIPQLVIKNKGAVLFSNVSGVKKVAAPAKKVEPEKVASPLETKLNNTLKLINSAAELEAYYADNKATTEDIKLFNKLVSIRKKQLEG